MRFTVVWWQAADDELTRLWLNSADRAAITNATHELDQLLSTSAPNAGAEVHEGLRAIEVGPRHLQFSVEEADRIVRVWTVRLVSA